MFIFHIDWAMSWVKRKLRYFGIAEICYRIVCHPTIGTVVEDICQANIRNADLRSISEAGLQRSLNASWSWLIAFQGCKMAAVTLTCPLGIWPSYILLKQSIFPSSAFCPHHYFWNTWIDKAPLHIMQKKVFCDFFRQGKTLTIFKIKYDGFSTYCTRNCPFDRLFALNFISHWTSLQT